MTDTDIVVQLPLFSPQALGSPSPGKHADLHTRWLHPHDLRPLITESAPALRLLELLGPLHWDHLPERNLLRDWGKPTISNATLIVAELIKLEEGLPSFGHLYRHLCDHAALVSLLGLSLIPAPKLPGGFNTRASLPTERHFTRMLRLLPNATLQYLLDDSVQLIGAELAARGIAWGDCISLDTKHILAWVQENNPKAYLSKRYDKGRQPKGDPDCRLGCKRRHNQSTTPTREGIPASATSVGEFYWGYGSGVVATLVPGLGEFVLAELTQPFDQGDLTYFLPLMHMTAQRLGHTPRFGTFDAAFDAWYVYAYFSPENGVSDGMAAVPFSHKGGFSPTDRRFSPEGLPLCAAGLPMPLQQTFTDRTSCLVEHQRGVYGCPLTMGTVRHRVCPVHHERWSRGGCTAMMPTSLGSRLRVQIDREGEPYKSLYRQRTAVERINSQAVALGIERPHLRSGAAIANQNTLIYLLINLRFLQRLRQASYVES
jgi:hypothetical protein